MNKKWLKKCKISTNSYFSIEEDKENKVKFDGNSVFCKEENKITKIEFFLQKIDQKNNEMLLNFKCSDEDENN